MTASTNPVVFRALPTAGCVRDGALTEQTTSVIAKLHDVFPALAFIAPMLQDYQLLRFLNNNTATYEMWGRRCEAVLHKCDALWVLMFPGWEQSVGVTGEIEYARKHNIPVLYVDVND